MRLLTRSNFDGLVCAVLLKEVEQIDEIEFHHPKDMQEGKIKVTANDIIANLPYHPDAGMWFDNHASEAARNEDITFKGRFADAPSAARVVYDYYVLQGKGEKLAKYQQLLTEVDKFDSANLEPEDVINPKGWILLSYLMDPRTGLGKQHDYQISNKALMRKLVDWMSEKTPEEILNEPDIKERVERYFKQEEEFRKVQLQHSRQDGNVVITDFRGVEVPIGNRFVIYTQFPTANISIRIMDGKKGEFCSIAVGHSIFNRTSRTDVGALMAKYGGGGHRSAGTCQLPYDVVDAKVAEMIAIMKKDG